MLRVGTVLDYAGGIALQPDGKLLVSGISWVCRTQRFEFPGGAIVIIRCEPTAIMTRLSTNGALDTRYGDRGFVRNQGPGFAAAVAIQGDRALLAGSSSFLGGDFAVARFLK